VILTCFAGQGDWDSPISCFHRSHESFTRCCLAPPYADCAFDKIHVTPAEPLYFAAAHYCGIQSENCGKSCGLPLWFDCGHSEQPRFLFIAQCASNVAAFGKARNLIGNETPSFARLSTRRRMPISMLTVVLEIPFLLRSRMVGWNCGLSNCRPPPIPPTTLWIVRAAPFCSGLCAILPVDPLDGMGGEIGADCFA